ncbi:peroxisomal (S)-2-hydroxy-acid oxidase GLO4-like protein, partial [Tanacetum coccineum]
IKAVEVGVDGIIVSSHGGRQRDSVPTTIADLRESKGGYQFSLTRNKARNRYVQCFSSWRTSCYDWKSGCARVGSEGGA